MNAAAELQKAVFDALRLDTSVTNQLGGGKIFDHAPANVPFPYITLGQTTVYDWSTSTEIGAEHLFTLHVWSKAKGKAETLSIMDAAKSRLHDTSLALDGHRLVNIRHELAEARFDDDLSVYHGSLRFRAVTEDV